VPRGDFAGGTKGSTTGVGRGGRAQRHSSAGSLGGRFTGQRGASGLGSSVDEDASQMLAMMRRTQLGKKSHSVGEMLRREGGVGAQSSGAWEARSGTPGVYGMGWPHPGPRASLRHPDVDPAREELPMVPMRAPFLPSLRNVLPLQAMRSPEAVRTPLTAREVLHSPPTSQASLRNSWDSPLPGVKQMHLSAPHTMRGAGRGAAFTSGGTARGKGSLLGSSDSGRWHRGHSMDGGEEWVVIATNSEGAVKWGRGAAVDGRDYDSDSVEEETSSEEEDEEESMDVEPAPEQVRPPPKRCLSCGRETTPRWRRGPQGRQTLCNSCGLRYLRDVKLAEQKKSENTTMS